MKHLRLDTNRLTALKAGMFNELVAVEILNLSNNYINSIENKTFSNLNKLDILWLSNNSLEMLNHGMFFGLDSLKTLILAKNPLTTLPADVFKHLPRPLTISITELKDNGNPSAFPIQCNSELCWLKQEELQGTIAWYRTPPVCADRKDWRK